ncbi:MAG: threonine-phosphate decarboxylase, partial [Caulobacteraceae bacterium]|nr:threonine-phosphate decarboxylase [Caulobacter sp.]
LYPAAPQPWIDLSTGINPVAYPFGELPPDAFATLPSASALAALERVAAARTRVPPGCAIVAAPGTQAIIQRLPALCPGRDVRVLAPTYAEFARVFRAADAKVRDVPSFDALAGADVAVVVNPNNPDGRLLASEALAGLARRVGALVVDEAFADALPPPASLVPRLPAQGALVLRSFGKTYGLPGLRLGFAIAPDGQAEALRAMLGPWPVSGPALAVATRALADDAWLDAARRRLGHDGARLGALLARIGARPVGETPLFRLIAHPAAPDLFATLAAHGILTRPFAGEPSWLRFGLPGSKPTWVRLEDALRAFRRG